MYFNISHWSLFNWQLMVFQWSRWDLCNWGTILLALLTSTSRLDVVLVVAVCVNTGSYAMHNAYFNRCTLFSFLACSILLLLFIWLVYLLKRNIWNMWLLDLWCLIFVCCFVECAPFIFTWQVRDKDDKLDDDGSSIRLLHQLHFYISVYVYV